MESNLPHIHMSAIRQGVLDLLQVYPLEVVTTPTPPRTVQEHLHLFWADDWWRGIALARECCDLVLRGLSQESTTLVTRLFLLPSEEEQVDKLPHDLQVAYENLEIMIHNLVVSGDPDVPSELGQNDLLEVCENT